MTIKRFAYSFLLSLAAGTLFIATAQTSSPLASIERNDVRSSTALETPRTTANGNAEADVFKRSVRINLLNGTQTSTNQGCNPATTGSLNSCYGFSSGPVISTGSSNAFFGSQSAYVNTTGSFNAFFGHQAGSANTSGGGNSFFGATAGRNNTTGERNVYIGHDAGRAMTTESDNTFIGFDTTGTVGITNATTIGSRSSVTRSNSLVLGSIKGINSATADTNVGIGTTAPKARLNVKGGDVYIETASKGIILRTPDNLSCYRVTINNSGALTTAKVTCPQ
ncbi:MAG: hypothetical protein ICV60_05840 [Pyrinomonadaceae bacterium]|nr:hypothetical protein [Pyrinomonadaceae bacterium]